GQVVGPLFAADGGRGGVQEPQRRSGHPAGLSPTRGAHRGPRLPCLPGLLPACHLGAAPACAGARTDATHRVGQVWSWAYDRRASTDHRWPRAGAHPLHRARTRAPPVDGETETGAARPTATENRRGLCTAAEVPTFWGRLQQTQILRGPKVLESVK